MAVVHSPATTLSSFRNRHAAGGETVANDAAPESLSLELFDVDLLSQAVADSGLEHRQLGQGRFRGELKRLRLEGLCVDSGRYNQTLQSRGSFASGSVVIGCILEAREAGCINAHRFGRHDLVVFPEGAEMDYLVPANTHWLAIQAPPSVLLDTGIDPEALRRVAVFSATRPANKSLADLLRGLVASGSCGGLALSDEVPGPEALADELLDRVGLALCPEDARPHTRRASLHKRAALVRRFERALADAGFRAPRMPELAAGLGVSQRTLEQVFREHLNMSPKRFVLLTRLNRIYCDLLRSSPDDTTVAALAGGHGVRQLGRFSAEYRAQFGELPSETLRRPR